MRPYGVKHMHGEARNWDLYPAMDDKPWSACRRIRRGFGAQTEWYFRYPHKNHICERQQRKRARRDSKQECTAAE